MASEKPSSAPDLIILLPGRSPSQNKLNKMHWRSRMDLKKEWLQNMMVALGGRKREVHRTVLITSMGPANRGRMDYDNHVAGCKSVVVDNLRNLGLIRDDDLDSVTIHYEQAKAPASQTEVRLWIT